MNTKSKTLKLQQDLWLFSNSPNDQTHTIKPKGTKVKVIFSMRGFSAVYDHSHYSGKVLSATLKDEDLRAYFNFNRTYEDGE